MLAVAHREVEAPALIPKDRHKLLVGARRLRRRAEVEHLPMHAAIGRGEVVHTGLEDDELRRQEGTEANRRRRERHKWRFDSSVAA